MTAPILAIGNAIVDIIAETDDEFLVRHLMNKGGMQLIESAEAQAQLLGELGEMRKIPGGSAANTAVGIVSCGGSASFIGKLGRDELGQAFASGMTEAGVGFTATYDDAAPTASSIILVTPDAERTMNTHLGASCLMTPDDIPAEEVAGSAWAYLEGYMFDMPLGPQCFDRVAEAAGRGDTRLALSLSDRWCVERHHGKLLAFIKSHVDLLLGNEDEMAALTEKKGEAMLDAASALADEVVVTMSAKGAVVIRGDTRHEIAAVKNVNVVDTTGAGDLFAAGYLFAKQQGGDAVEAGRSGAIAAGEVISHIGARPLVPLAGLMG